MKRIALWALLVFLTTTALGSERQRYLVATKRSPRVLAPGSLAAELRDPAKRVETFRIVDAFAADLTEEEAAALRQSPDVRWIEPNLPRYWMASAVTPGSQMIPVNITQVQAPGAWAARPSGTVNVALIDSGFDHRHPDLAPAFEGGHNVTTPDATWMDTIGHGTHVGGTIVAANNNFGVIGVAPKNVRLWAIRVSDPQGRLTVEYVMKAVDWVAAKKKETGGRWVVNLSLGGDEPSEIERETFRRAVDDGIIVVAATGNESGPNLPKPVAYPAAYDRVVSVGAVDDQQTHASFSNQGPEVDFVAPGVRVVSTLISGNRFASYVRAGTDSKLIEATPLVGSKMESLTGEYVYCGLGEAQDFTAAVQGKIALIKRGGDTFANKTRRAVEAGAIGVVIFNHDGSGTVWTLHDMADPKTKEYAWPVVVALSKRDGDPLAEAGSGRISIAWEPDDYGQKSGTSMSAPHVTGAIALLWSLAPFVSPDGIINALIVTAKDLGDPGKDSKYGYGAIDVHAAARFIAPEAFNPNGRTTGRRFVTRGRKK